MRLLLVVAFPLPGGAALGDLAFEASRREVSSRSRSAVRRAWSASKDAATVLGLPDESAAAWRASGGLALGELAELGDLVLDLGAECVRLADGDRTDLGRLGHGGPRIAAASLRASCTSRPASARARSIVWPTRHGHG